MRWKEVREADGRWWWTGLGEVVHMHCSSDSIRPELEVQATVHKHGSHQVVNALDHPLCMGRMRSASSWEMNSAALSDLMTATWVLASAWRLSSPWCTS